MYSYTQHDDVGTKRKWLRKFFFSCTMWIFRFRKKKKISYDERICLKNNTCCLLCVSHLLTMALNVILRWLRKQIPKPYNIFFIEIVILLSSVLCILPWFYYLDFDQMRTKSSGNGWASFSRTIACITVVCYIRYLLSTLFPLKSWTHRNSN